MYDLPKWQLNCTSFHWHVVLLTLYASTVEVEYFTTAFII